MRRDSLRGGDLITTQEWSAEELNTVFDLAFKMKRERYSHPLSNCLSRRTFFMLFYNPSLGTRLSFEAAVTELGGHAQYLEPSRLGLDPVKALGDTVKDTANVMSRYGVGIGIRILEGSVERYGDGNRYVREFAQDASVPIINMADDMYHPCQGLADLMGMRERLGDAYNSKKLAIVWGYSQMLKPSCAPVHSLLLVATRLGMKVTFAYPEGFDVDENVIETCRKNAASTNSSFEVTHDMKEAYAGANVVYSRNCISPQQYGLETEQQIQRCDQFRNWRCSRELMALTEDALFHNPMPVDRGNEAEDEVVDSERSIMYDVAENKLHLQKAGSCPDDGCDRVEHG